VQLHLLWLQSRHLRRDQAIGRLKLRAGPDFASIGPHVGDAILRFHRRMREIGHLVHGR
jgi:hypothetical protein